MKLSRLLSSDFESHVRARGERYYRSGAVHVKTASQTAVEARVQGARDYQVALRWDGEQLNVRCSCPYFESSGPCKHLWAVVLEAEAQEYLADALVDELDFIMNEDLPGEEPLPDRPQPPPPTWRDQLKVVTALDPAPDERWPAGRELLYVVDAATSVSQGGLVLNLLTREPKRSGGWKKPQPLRLTRNFIPRLADPADRHILGLLAGANAFDGWMYSGTYVHLSSSFRVMHPLSATVMPLVAATGRCLLGAEPLAWDDGEPWRFELRLDRAIRGCLRRGDEELDLKTPQLITAGGLVFSGGRVARLAEETRFEWLLHLRRAGSIEIPAGEAQQALAALLNHPVPARVEVPEELRYEEVRVTPRPWLTLRALKRYSWEQSRLRAELSFD